MAYQKVNEGTKNAMRLQSIGLVLGTPAGEIKEGNTLMWNFGETSEVLQVLRETALTISVQTKTKTGNTYDRRFRKSRLVCILKPKK